MGEVWAAVSDEGSPRWGDGAPGPREVAIKVLLARAAMKPDLVRRFEREAKIASAIKSPFVCQLIEVGQADDGAHLLVFEHLNGESLADRLKREQYLPFSEVGPIIEDVLQGLVAAHEAGVIHRDLKPGNIFLESPRDESFAPGFEAEQPRRERAKILDFGISKLSRREKEEPTLTAFDATLGSFAYMAPEQVRGAARADERADIYAVGAVAFRALSGRLPFEGSTAAVLVAMKLDRSAPSLAEATGEQWPAGIERFLERALERRREARFGTAAEALAAWRSVQPARVAIEAPDTPPDHAEPVPLVKRAPPPPAPSRPAAPLAPARAKTPIPVPTKPVFAQRSGIAGGSPRPPAAPLIVPQRAPSRPMARHGTLTMDELPPDDGALPPAGGGPAAAPGAPGPRPPMQSYQIIEDNPTEVDGPPEMTFDGSYNPVAAGSAGGDPPHPPHPPAKPPHPDKRGKTGRH